MWSLAGQSHLQKGAKEVQDSCYRFTQRWGSSPVSELQHGFWERAPEGKLVSHVAVKSLAACYMMQATWQMLELCH